MARRHVVLEGSAEIEMSDAIPILMYHQLSPRPAPEFFEYTVTPRAFAVQMKWLAVAGYESITLDDLLARRHRGAALPSRPVIITFDDGFQDCIEYAVPILQARAFTAVFYLVAELMGQSSRWVIPELGIEFPLADWETARSLEEAGFQCGSHTSTHPHLAALTDEACRDELLRSRLLIEEQLGHPIVHLAYPHGSYDARVERIAAESGYVSACSTQEGVSTPDDDPLALHRVAVSGYDSLGDFITHLHP